MASPAVYDAFATRLGDWTTTPIIFENEFAQQYIDAGMQFVYVEIYGDTFNQESLGSPQHNLWLEEGTTFMHVMTPAGAGSRDARVYANELLNLFREQPIVTDNVTGESLFMPEMSIGAGQPGQDFPNYYAITASIHWRRREVTSL